MHVRGTVDDFAMALTAIFGGRTPVEQHSTRGTDIMCNTRLAESITFCLDANVPLLMEGPPACGKTYSVKEVCAARQQTLKYTINTESTTPQDYIGQILPGGLRKFDITKGILVNAMESGSVIFIDEYNLATRDVQNCLMPVLDQPAANGRRGPLINPTGEPIYSQP